QVYDGGISRQATADNFPVSKGIAGVYMQLQAGGLRELHWHANAAEWAYVLSGRVRTTIIDPDGRSQRVDFGPGDVWFFPRGYGPVAPPLPADPPPASEKSTPLSHRFRLEAQPPRRFASGEVRFVTVKEFPISTTMCGATMSLKPGGLRALHWHPNADEWQYV